MHPLMTLDADSAALDWVQRHQSLYLTQDALVQACARYLVNSDSATLKRANEAALHAVGELLSRSRPAYIDKDRSTSYALYVVDPRRGHTRTFTAAQLLDLADDAANAEPHPLSGPVAGTA